MSDTRFEIEQGLIGCLMVEPREIPAVTAIVRAGDFETFGSVFEMLADLHDTGLLNGGSRDAGTIASELKRRDLIDIIGGTSGLAVLFQHVIGNSRYYARELVRASGNDRLTSLARQMADDARRKESDPTAIATEAVAVLEAIASRQAISFRTLGEEMAEAVRDFRTPRKPVLYSGFKKLDSHLLGFAPGELVVVSAATSGGKSAFALNVADNIGREGLPVLFITCEMRVREEIARLFARWCGIPLGRFRVSGELREADFERMSAAVADAEGHGLRFLYAPCATWRQIESQIKVFHARHGLALIVLDYVGLVAPESSRQTKQETVATITSGLKKLAGQLDAVCMGLVQVNRAGSQGKEVGLSNMADSSSVERDADVVVNIAREQGDGADPECRRFQILKHRQGEPVDVTGYRFDGPTMRFMEPGGPVAKFEEFSQGYLASGFNG